MDLAQFLEKTHRIFYNLGQFWKTLKQKTLKQNNLATTNNKQLTINN